MLVLLTTPRLKRSLPHVPRECANRGHQTCRCLRERHGYVTKPEELDGMLCIDSCEHFRSLEEPLRARTKRMKKGQWRDWDSPPQHVRLRHTNHACQPLPRESPVVETSRICSRGFHLASTPVQRTSSGLRVSCRIGARREVFCS